MPFELITMIGGAVTGFIFRFMAERAKERARLWEMALGKKKAEDDNATYFKKSSFIIITIIIRISSSILE